MIVVTDNDPKLAGKEANRAVNENPFTFEENWNRIKKPTIPNKAANFAFG